MISFPTDLAHQLAHIAHQLHEAITALLNDTRTQGTLHQQLTAFRHTILPNIQAKEFADMYAQTLVYGLFAARVTKSETATFTRFDAAQAIPTTNPLLRNMFQQIAAFDLDERIAKLVDECAHVLQQTDMSEVLRDFGKATMQEDPVVHFYESFLATYDPTMREMRGVYYTPQPVVSYIVRSVDYLLKTRFNKPDGLADDTTLILDPATGTATFLHAVVQHIYTSLQNHEKARAWKQYVRDKLLPRVSGFELLMAPYAIAHLKLSMLLQQLGYDFGSTEQLGIYLANALEERGIAHNGSTTQQPVMVVLGNPPYSNYGMQNTSQWIRKQLEEYKQGLQEKKLNLDDAFIKFIRLGQWHIEQTGQGILAYITNNTYIDGITHRRMRESLMETFSDIYILDLHGSSLKKEVCPDGSLDENVFDIRQGVAIGIFVKQPGHRGNARVHHADMWGTRASKYARLQHERITSTVWTRIQPHRDWFFFVPKHFDIADEYTPLPRLTDVFTIHQNVIKTDRDRLFFDAAYATLKHRIQQFYSDAGLQSPFRETYRVEDSSSYRLLARRHKTSFNQRYLRPALYRPFDKQWLYYAPDLTSRPAWDVMRHMIDHDNIALLGMRQYEYEVADYCYTFVTESITESRIFISNRGGASMFPLYLYPAENDMPNEETRYPNFSDSFIHDVEHRLGLSFIPDGTGDVCTTLGPEDIFHYIYAILHSPTYRTRYAEFLKIDFPRVPITSDTALFKTLADYGATLVDLHLLRLPGSGGVGGAGGAAMLSQPDQYAVGQHNITHAPIEKIIYNAQQQRVVIGAGMYIEGVEPETWAMQIGGYQPLHKWLKDRKERTLSCDDARHYMRMVLALRETRHLMAAIDATVPAWPVG